MSDALLREAFADPASGSYVRAIYRVPAHIGGRVAVDGQPGQIVGFDGQYLSVRIDGDPEPVLAHPTWRVVYEDGEPA